MLVPLLTGAADTAPRLAAVLGAMAGDLLGRVMLDRWGGEGITAEGRAVELYELRPFGLLPFIRFITCRRLNLVAITVCFVSCCGAGTLPVALQAC
jgi:hypothetical protein